MPESRAFLTKLAARVVLLACYATTLLACRIRPRAAISSAPRRLVLIGTFHNPGWFRSHVAPLCAAGLAVTVVTDAPVAGVAGVEFYCPPAVFQRLFGRMLPRLLWTLLAGRRYRPDLFVAYHIFPNSLIALVAARVYARAACYQMTGGPVQIEGGGYRCENRLLARLGSPSRLLESLAVSLLRQFHSIIVRGTRAREFLAGYGIVDGVAIIPGSVPSAGDASATADRPYDLIYVGRLVAGKQPLNFLKIVAGLMRPFPHLQAVVAGNGPLLDAMRSIIERDNLTNCVQLLGQTDEVQTLLAQARVFVLTSASEGLSIAMAEAMSAGTVPVVSDVGDLRDLVDEGKNGFLVDPSDLGEYCRVVEQVLSNAERWQMLSQAAMSSARSYASVEVVTAKWRAHLEELGRGCNPVQGHHGVATKPISSVTSE